MGSRYASARDVLTRTASPGPGQRFDIFLSHSFQDADLILGVLEILSSSGLSVYVDWVVDGGLSRSNVNRSTAERLRERMKSCNSLVFATSSNSPSSKWMPWELGYFDGLRGERIAIMPIEDPRGTSSGQEYLDLYPRIEKLPELRSGAPFVVRNGRVREYTTLSNLARGSVQYQKVR